MLKDIILIRCHFYLFPQVAASHHPDADDCRRPPPLQQHQGEPDAASGPEPPDLPADLQPGHLLLGHHGGQELLLHGRADRVLW